MNEPSEDAVISLIIKVREDNPHAKSDLFILFNQDLKDYVKLRLRRLHDKFMSIDVEAAEDLSQKAWEKAFAKIDRFDIRKAFWSRIKGYAKNIIKQKHGEWDSKLDRIIRAFQEPLYEVSENRIIDIITAIKQGNPVAIKELKDIYEHDLVEFVRMILTLLNCADKTVSVEDAQNIAQMTFNEVIQKINDFDISKAFLIWVKGYADKIIIQYKFDVINEPIVVPLDKPCGNSDDNSITLKDLIVTENLDPFRQAEKMMLDFVVISNFLFVISLCGGYPHESLTYLLSKCLHGEETQSGKSGNTKRRFEGKPKMIDEKYGHMPLVKLAELYWKFYQIESELPADKIKDLSSCLNPLHERLPLTVREIFSEEVRLTTRLKNILDLKVAETMLRSYYTRKGLQTISDWEFNVERRVKEVLLLSLDSSNSVAIFPGVLEKLIKTINPIACSHCKLKHLPPCVNKTV